MDKQIKKNLLYHKRLERVTDFLFPLSILLTFLEIYSVILLYFSGSLLNIFIRYFARQDVRPEATKSKLSCCYN